MTIDQGTDTSRYQGLVALDGGSLEDAAHEYFRSSEQIPTRVRLAVGEEMSPGLGHRWRAGGMLLQFLPKAPERARVPDLPPGDAPEGMPAHEVAEDDAWVEGRSMIETVEDLELLDPSLSSERLVYRLFHERGVRVFKSVPIVAQCSCSRDGVEAMLRSFSQDDRDHMVENGKISVTCEFCSAHYEFEPDNVRREAGGRIRRGKARDMNESARRVAAVIAVVAGATAHSMAAARAQSCPAPLANAKRLVLVTAPTMNDTAATMRLYERASASEAWRALGDTEPATIGRDRDGLVAVFHEACSPRRTDQGRRRQTGAGRPLYDRPELWHSGIVAAELSAGDARHDLRARSFVAGLQHHRVARPSRSRGLAPRT